MKRLLIHLVLIALLFVSWLPVAKIFYSPKVPIGIDTFNFTYYILNFRENLAFPVSAWKMQAFEGMPRLLDTSWLHFYIIQPLVSAVGVFASVKVYPLVFLFLFIMFSYLLFFEISKNYLLSFGLAVLLARTGAIYIPLYSSGVVLSSISQTFFPLALYFLVRYCRRGNAKHLTIAGLSLAAGMYTHPGTTAAVTLPSVLLFLIFSSSEKVGAFAIGKKIVISLKVLLTAFFVGALVILPNLWVKFMVGGHQWLKVNLNPETHTFSLLLQTVNPISYVAVALAVLFGLYFSRRINRLVVPFLGITLFFLVFIWTLFAGFNPLGGFMFPHRIYWFGIVGIFASVAALVSPGLDHLRGTYRVAVLVLTRGVFPLVLLASLLLPIERVLPFLGKEFFLSSEAGGKPEDPKAVYSRLFFSLVDADPSAFQSAGQSYRLYALDYAHNLNVGIASPMPQVRGGFHYSTARNADWFAWTDAALAQESQDKKRIDPFVAERQSLYLIDWYAMKYLLSVPMQPGELASWFFDSTKPYVAQKIIAGRSALFTISDS